MRHHGLYNELFNSSTARQLLQNNDGQTTLNEKAAVTIPFGHFDRVIKIQSHLVRLFSPTEG